jgi:hypothetical protein
MLFCYVVIQIWDSNPSLGFEPAADRLHVYFANQNSKISIRGKFSGFGVAQPDLANGTRSQVQMKKHLRLFHLHSESRAVRKYDPARAIIRESPNFPVY